MEKKGNLRYFIIIIMFAVFLTAYFDRLNVTVLLADPNFTDTFGMTGDTAKQGLLMSVFMFSYGICNFMAGPAVKRFGPRGTLLFATLSWIVLMLVMGSVNAFAVLILCRVILGVGEAVMTPACNVIVQRWFPQQERSRANSIWFLGVLLAPAIAVPLVIWALNAFAWRGSFYTLAVIGLIPLILIFIFVKNFPQELRLLKKAELEYINNPLPVKEKENGPAANVTQKSANWAKDYRFWFTLATSCCIVAFFWGLAAWVPSYFKVTLGFSWKSMGALASLPYIAGTVAVLTLSPIMDRLNLRGIFIMVGYVLGAISLFASMFSQNNLTVAILIALAIAFSIPGGPATYTIIQNLVPAQNLAVAAGVFNGVGYMYASLAPYIIGLLNTATGSFSAGFYFLIANAVVGAFCAIPLVKQRL